MIRLIAHRGACLETQEDTLAALERAAFLGADAVECDPQMTKDGVAVIFHDDDLMRLANDPARVSDVTCDEMREKLACAGMTLTTLEETVDRFSGRSAVLFDMHADAQKFIPVIAKAKYKAIAGVCRPEDAEFARRYFPAEQVLAFMPQPEMVDDFVAAGAGIIRLWEWWLPGTPVAKVREAIPADRKIFIMSYASVAHPLWCMNSSPEQLDRLDAMGVDGVLLNDITMGLKWRRQKEENV